MTGVLVLSAVLFAVGAYGVFSRRNAIGIIISLEIMMNAANLNLVGFSRLYRPELMTGQSFALFAIAIAASEAAVGLALVLAVYRRFGSTDVEDINILKG